jgi:large subunit ribosomal protein L4
MQVDVFNIQKEKVGSLELPDDVFAAEVKEAVVWEQVKAQLASRRRGTHATKTRADVSGGGIKPYRQKGTGRARQGSLRAPNHVGGGKVFGPHPRDYAYRLPRSARRAALKSALTLRAKDGLLVLEALPLEAAKTRALAGVLDRLEVRNALIVDTDNKNLRLAARNLGANETYKSKYLVPGALNVYDILDHPTLILTRGAIEAVVRRARGGAEAAAA